MTFQIERPNRGSQWHQARMGFMYFLLFVLIPFSQSVPLFAVAGRTVNVGMHTIIVAAIIAGTLFGGFRGLSFQSERATVVVILLGVWSLVTIVAMVPYATNTSIANSLVTWLRWTQLLPVFCLIVWGVGTEKSFNIIVRILIIMGVLIGVWALYEDLFPSEFASTYFRGAVTFTRPLFRETEIADVVSSESGFYAGSANYNIAGTFSAMAALMAIPFLFRQSEQAQRGKGLLLSWGAAGILIGGIVASQSRSALISFMLGFLAVVMRKSLPRLLLIGCSSAVLLVAFAITYEKTSYGTMIAETVVNLPEAIPLVLRTPEYNQDIGFSIHVFGAAKRVATVVAALNVFADNPIFGCGFFHFSSAAPDLGTAENFYAQMLAETGLIGLALVVIFLLVLWSYSHVDFGTQTFSYVYQRGYRGVLIAAVVANLSGTLFYDQRIWGLLLFLSAIQIRLARAHMGRNRLPTRRGK